MNLLLFIIGEILFIGLVIGTVVIDTPFMYFADIISMLITVGMGFSLTVISFSFRDIGKAFAHAFDGAGSSIELQRSAYVWEGISRNLILGSVIGTIIGIVKILNWLDDPTRLGEMIAIAMLTTLYGMFLSLVLPLPAMFIIKKRIEDVEV